MLYIDDVQLKPKTTTRVLITYWPEGYGCGPIVSVTASVRRRLKTTTGRRSWQIQIDGRSTPSIVREIELNGYIELILEL